MQNKRSTNNSKAVLKAITVFVLCLVVFAAAFVLSDVDLRSYLPFGVDSGFDTEDDFVRIIDVGQGDSILIYSNGYSALIDTGIGEASAEICAVLEDCGITKLDVLLITHLDNDHTGGIDDITSIFGAKNLILPEISIESEGLSAAENAISNITNADGDIYTAVQGMNFDIGEFELTVLGAFSNMADENNRSIITAAKIKDFGFLFTGDIEAKAEKALLNENLDLKCDVLKVAHHGSSTSSTMEFLKAVRPRYAAISAGKDNIYGHPHSEVLSALEYMGTRIYRTDVDGDITFYIDDNKIVPKTEK